MRRLCAAMWPGQKVDVYGEQRCFPQPGKRRPQYKMVAHVVVVGRSFLTQGTELGRGCIATYAWEAARDALPQRMAERVLEIDREMAAMAEERARLTAALSSLDGGAP